MPSHLIEPPPNRMAGVTQGTAAGAARVGEHAIVIGASVAGLLAARVLADFFERVTMLERDTLPGGLADRRAVPQGRHAHALHFAGQEALERLLPDYRSDAVAAGAPPCADASALRFRVGGHPLCKVDIGAEAVVSSRSLLEGLIRRRINALANVTIRDRCGVLGLLSENGRVTGVRALDRDERGDEQALNGDLVVAATGRGAKVPAWLESMGYERPAEERVQVDIMYASRHLRLRPGALGSDMIVFNGPKAGRPRGMALFLEEDDRWLLTLHGYGAEHHPPTDNDAFNAFAATVTDADVQTAIEEAEAIDEITTHAYPAGVRRRYERLRRVPDGLLVIGDAICSFNPIYGQGMTVAMLQAEALARCLQQGDHQIARRYFKAAGRPVEHAWKLSTGADLALPEVAAQAALPDRIVSRYLERLLAVAEHDEHVTRAFLSALGMLNSPTSLLQPTIALRVVRGSLFQRTASSSSRHSRPGSTPLAFASKFLSGRVRQRGSRSSHGQKRACELIRQDAQRPCACTPSPRAGGLGPAFLRHDDPEREVGQNLRAGQDHAHQEEDAHERGRESEAPRQTGKNAGHHLSVARPHEATLGDGAVSVRE